MRVTMMVRCLAMMRGGGETRHLAWARELTAIGVDVDFIVGRPFVFGSSRYPVEGFPTTTLRSPYARNFVYRFQHTRGFGRLTMYALHADEELFCRAAWTRIADASPRPDVVHAHALYQTARLRRENLPVVIHVPGDPHDRYTSDLQKADAVVADGWAADVLPEKLGRPVDRIAKGVDADRFTPDGSDLRQTLRLSDAGVIVTVARLVPIKNLRLLIDALALLRDRQCRAHLVIVGEGPDAEGLRSHAAMRGVENAVTFVGYVDQADTPAYYRSADVFALPSDFDNSPNAVLEAMACGLPIVATDVGGVRDFVVDRVGGAVVPPRDPEALAAAIETYLVSPVAAREAGRFNRKRTMAEFTWRASTLKLLAVYGRAIEARTGQRRPADAVAPAPRERAGSLNAK